MSLYLIHLLLEGVGRVDMLAAAQGQALMDGGGHAGDATCHIEAELGDAVIRFREFPVAAGVLLVPHVPPQRGHERPDPLPQLVDPAGDIRPLAMAVLLDQIEVPLLQIIDPQVPQGGEGSVIIVRLLVLRGCGGYLGLFHGILT